MKNGDAIRSMTDEELARYFSIYCWSDGWCKHQRKCEACWLEWLKQEAVDNGACSADETSGKVQSGE